MIILLTIIGGVCTFIGLMMCLNAESFVDDEEKVFKYRMWFGAICIIGFVLMMYGLVINSNDTKFKTNIQYNMGVCPLCSSKWVLIDTITRQKESDVTLYSCGNHLLMLDGDSTPRQISLDEKSNPKNKESIDAALSEILVLPKSTPVIEKEN